MLLVSCAVSILICFFVGHSRSFGVFLLSPLLLTWCVVPVILAGWASWLRRGALRALVLSTALLAALPLAVLAGARYGDHADFYTWAAPRVLLLHQASGQDQVLKHWDAWGIAGMENDSYLVVDTTDTLDEPDGVARWTTEVGFGCEVVKAKRLWPRFYLVVTFRCGS